MGGRSFRIATIGGIPVRADASWIWIALLVTYSLWIRFHALTGGRRGALLVAVFTAACFFGTVLVHELAHAAVARLQGMTVFGITLVVFGGFTSARTEERGPWPAFLVAAAGPMASLALGLALRALAEAVDGPLVATALHEVGWVSLVMAVFNVLPGLPLDGGRMVQALVWRATGDNDRATRVAARAGMAIGGLLVASGAWRMLRGSVVEGIWLGIIGAFILQNARTSADAAGVASRLARGRVRDVLEPPPATVPADIPLSEALDRFLRGHDGDAFPVVDGGRLIGMISLASASEIGAVDPLRPVRDALIPLDDVLVVHPDEPLDEVGARLSTTGTALVVDGDDLVGTISGPRVLAWARSGGVGGRE
jgi:Zn-dependent protease